MKPLAALVALAILAGCAAEQRYPSLLPRANEKMTFAEPAVASPPPVSVDPALDARLGEVTGKLDAIIHGFDVDLGKARSASAVAGSRTVGSEAWLTAQAALAGLDDWRSQATALASDVETLGGERLATAGAPYPALDALQARAAAEVDRQSQAIAALSAALTTP